MTSSSNRKPTVRRVREWVPAATIAPRAPITRIRYEEDAEDLAPTKVGPRSPPASAKAAIATADVPAGSTYESGIRELLASGPAAAELDDMTVRDLQAVRTWSANAPRRTAANARATQPDEPPLSSLVAVYEERVEKMLSVIPPAAPAPNHDRRRAPHVLGRPSLLALAVEWMERARPLLEHARRLMGRLSPLLVQWWTRLGARPVARTAVVVVTSAVVSSLLTLVVAR